MAQTEVFNWIRPGYELVTVKLEWNVQVPFLQTTDGKGKKSISPLFSPQETPNSKWQLLVAAVWDDDWYDDWDKGRGRGEITITANHRNSTGCVNFVEPALVKPSILNNRR